MNKIIFKDNTSLIDCTIELDNYSASNKSVPIVAAEDALYIGSKHPFNNIYFKMASPNLNASVMSVKYWDGDEWVSVVELIDETSGLTSSGFVNFVPNKDKSWTISNTNYGGDEVTDLTTLNIYDRYWLKITFSADFSALASIAWIGNKFSDDNDLAAEYPDLSRSSVMTAFKTGKTDWEEQHVKASEIMIKDMISKGTIKHVGAVLNRREFSDVCVSKCAEIIYSSFGTDYVDKAKECRARYNERLSRGFVSVDLNADAIEQVSERTHSTGFMSR